MEIVETVETIAIILGVWALIGQSLMIMNIGKENPKTDSDFARMILKYMGPVGLLFMISFLLVVRIPKYIRWKFRK